MTQKKFFVLIVALALLVSLVPVSLGASPAETPSKVDPAPEYMQPQTDAETPEGLLGKRWIVQLEAPPLAQYTGGVAGLPATATRVTGASRLNVNTPEAQAYIAHLEAQQAEVAAAVQQAMPGAYVEHDYQIVFNGLAVNLPQADEQADRWLSRLPGVKAVFAEQAHYLDMYASLPLIDAPTLWGMVDGQSEAGKGLKVAVIDTGTHPDNDCFDPTGYEYPDGYPLFDSDKPYTVTQKIIVARAYFRDNDPPLAGDEGTWPGTNGSSHGTHTAGTVACVPNTVASMGTYTETISGVAPAAYVMSYKAFYPTDSEFSGSAFDPELIAAIEDVVADGADVVNNSWGGGAPSAYPTALDLAYDAAWDAGVVVVFSAGNSGPYPSTVDHPSDKNILVGASTTDGTIAAGVLGVSAPEPISDTLQNMAFAAATFGEPLELGQVYQYNYLPAEVVSPTNYTGCDPWPDGTFTGHAAVISRGACEFGVKVLNAENAGAEFVVVHNDEARGDALVTMGGGAVGDQVTIPSVFVGYTDGQGMVTWYNMHGASSEITLDNSPYQAGNTPDRLAMFSSRGPSIRQMMDPDVVAPGVNIFSSGYGMGSGEARHLGFGQVSGTSMAAPHVAGAATVLKQLHPDWTPAQIKSALMSTAEIDVADYDGNDAGVLDHGAGRIDLGHAGDPGLTFDYPSLSFGMMYAGDSASMTVMATDVYSHAAPFTYTLSISETGDMTTTANFDLSVDQASLTFDGMGDTASFEVTVDVAADADPGDYEGYVWLHHGPHMLHIPVWVRVRPALGENPVLLIDAQLSLYTGGDYTGYYTHTLEALGVGYDYYDTLPYLGADVTFPPLTTLQEYEAVIWYTGDNFYSNIPTEGDEDILIAYLQGGGRLLATGQDLAGTTSYGDDTNLYNSFLGADYVQDNVYAGTAPTLPEELRLASGMSFAEGVTLSLGVQPVTGRWLDGANNQYWVDEVAFDEDADLPAQPLFQAISEGAEEDGYVGLTRASEPTLEEPTTIFDGRTAYLSFGFEGVNNPITGSLEMVASREDLMGHLLTFLWAQPTVQLADVTVSEPTTVTLVADAGFMSTEAFHTADIAGYRWDFGDGSPLVVTTVPTATHVYTATNSYTAQVEVKDSYGHRALDQSTVTVGGMYYIYLPIVMRNAAP